LLGHRILERHALRIVLSEPGIGSFLAGKDLQVILVANLLACVDVDPDGHALLNLQIGKAGAQSSLEKFDVHDVLVEHFQPLFPAPNLGI